MLRRLPLLASLLLIAPAAGAQSTTYCPDTMSAVGTCNAIPLGSLFSSGYTYVGRIPASFMDPQNNVVTDVSFAPCGTGTWTSSQIVMGMGHVPANFPCPFQFPVITPGSMTIGSFLDFTVLWDSNIHGAFNWSVVQDTWTPLGLPSVGTSFVWDGVNDVAFYITYSNAAVTGWAGDFRRTNTEPARSYASGYNAGSSTSCNAASGLKTALTVMPGAFVAQYQVNQSTASADVNAVQGNTAMPAMVTLPLGGSPGTMTLFSTAIGAGWDIAFGLAPPVPASGGGITLPDGQVFNLPLSDPSLSFLFAPGVSPGFVPQLLGIDASVPFAASFQMLVYDPGAPLGGWLSQPTRISVQ